MNVEHMTREYEEGSTKEKKTKFPEGEFLESAEMQEVNETKELQEKCSALDRDLISLLEHTFGSEVALKKGKAIDTLAFGREVLVKKLDKTGVNAISRREYAGDPPRVAFVKPQSGETNVLYDKATGKGFAVAKKKLPEGGFEEVRTVLPLDHTRGVKHFYETLAPRLKVGIARYYNISPEEADIYSNGFSGRRGVEYGKAAHREYAFSRSNELLQWEVVPLTVLRSDSDHTDISSVQEAVRGTGDKSPRSLDADLYKEIKKEGPEHPGADSFMRIACLDYLNNTSDRHPENVLYNSDEKKFYGIDNGRSSGLSAVTEGDPSTRTASNNLDNYLSVPLSVVQEFPGWKLDKDGQASLEKLYNNIMVYLEYKANPEQGSQKVDKPLGLEAKYLTKLFKVVFDNEKIASREMIEYVLRLKQLVKNGRPPHLEVGTKLKRVAQFYDEEESSEKLKN